MPTTHFTALPCWGQKVQSWLQAKSVRCYMMLWCIKWNKFHICHSSLQAVEYKCLCVCVFQIWLLSVCSFSSSHSNDCMHVGVCVCVCVCMCVCVFPIVSSLPVFGLVERNVILLGLRGSANKHHTHSETLYCAWWKRGRLIHLYCISILSYLSTVSL